MRCPYCSAENEEGAELCRKCGEELSGARDKWQGAKGKTDEGASSDVTSAHQEWDPAKRYSEPRAMSGFVPPPRHPDYLVWVITVFILCSPPTALIALIFSLLTRTENSLGNNARAYRYSQITRMWCVISLVIGIVVWVGVFFLLMHYAAGFWGS